MRGTFANIRLRNQLVPGVEGGFTVHLPDGEQTTIYDAAMRYKGDRVPLVILAGKEYGSGSSRDWAAKGTALLGVKAVIAESFERIHRSNLVNMGVLPLQFTPGENVASARAHRPRGLRDRAGSRPASSRAARSRSSPGATPGPIDVHGHRPDRHARGGRRVLARRHPAVRAAAARPGRQGEALAAGQRPAGTSPAERAWIPLPSRPARASSGSICAAWRGPRRYPELGVLRRVARARVRGRDALPRTHGRSRAPTCDRSCRRRDRSSSLGTNYNTDRPYSTGAGRSRRGAASRATRGATTTTTSSARDWTPWSPGWRRRRPRPFEARAYVDTGPVQERVLRAARAGSAGSARTPA